MFLRYYAREPVVEDETVSPTWLPRGFAGKSWEETDRMVTSEGHASLGDEFNWLD